MSYIKKKSQKQEARTAKDFQGATQLASGALSFAKGDVRTGSHGYREAGFNEEDYLIENKFTDKPKYKIEKSIWEKIEKEALKDNLRTPLLQVDVQESKFVIYDPKYFDDNLEEYLVERYDYVPRGISITLALKDFPNKGEYSKVNFKGVELVIVTLEDFLYFN